jgi:anti-sigma B factor antagonist
MQVRVKKIDGTGILKLEGDFLGEDDHHKVRERVCDLVKHGRTNLVLDLTHVEHINSCGLGSLVCALTTVRRAGGELRLTGAGVHVREILKITHLNNVFQICPSVSAALSKQSVHKN